MQPSAETLAIAYGSKNPRPRLWRPALGYCFVVWIDPAFTRSETELVRESMVAMIGCTAGDVGFETWLRGPHDVRIVKDGARPYNYAGLTYPFVKDDVMVGAEVVIHPQWVRHKVVNHELGHVLGMADAELADSVMGGLDIDAGGPTELDRIAWRYMASLEPGTLRPGLPPGARPFFRTPTVIVDAAA
jgi:hypothetical protein